MPGRAGHHVCVSASLLPGAARSPSVCAARKNLREMAERLADKYEEAKEKQEDLMNRSVAAGRARAQTPGRSCLGPPQLESPTCLAPG